MISYCSIYISHGISGFAQDSMSSISVYLQETIDQRMGQIRVNKGEKTEHSTG